MPVSKQSLVGIVALDKAGEITFIDGVGSDLRVRNLARDRTWLAETRDLRLRSLTLDRQGYVLLLIPHGDGDLILINDPSGDSVVDFISSVDFAYDILKHLVTDPFDAMTVIDAKGRVVFISPVHEAFFGLAPGEANGRHVKDVIENTRLDQVLSSGKAEVGEIQRMKSFERIVSRVPIKRGGQVVGAVGRVMFEGPRQVEALSRRINALESEVEFYRREAATLRGRTYGLESLIGQSAAMQRLRAEITKVAPLQIPVHIRGESGTGKELVAQSIHRLSPRRDEAMVMVNAAALPATLVETELFGYEAGAFTGADRKGRKGKFELAADGTIFLDEIGDTPLDVQVKLLRVLQDRRIERIGGEESRDIDFRLITATNRDLQALVAENKFRLDLYYRISAITIEVPPLRRRIDDLPALVASFLSELTERHRQRMPHISEEAMTYLMDQHWPGNVRQLRHEIERAVVFAEDGRIDLDTLTRYGDLPRTGIEFGAPPPSLSTPPTEEPGMRPMKQAVEQLESKLVHDAMLRLKGNKKRVAEELGISRSYLYKILDEAEPA